MRFFSPFFFFLLTGCARRVLTHFLPANAHNSLGGNKIGDEGARAVAEALKSNATLKEL